MQTQPATDVGTRTSLWVLLLMTLTYTSSFMDRTILSIIQNPIKEELGLSDTQLGLLGGFAFAIFYSTLGIPIARLAEQVDRRWLISVSLTIWSAATAMSGLARGFASLFLLRVAVGVGEAGASPPAHSLITDFFPPHRRGTAFSIYSLGVSAGVLIGATGGGYVAQTYGWRMTFAVFGIPGLLLAILIPLTIREPARGRLDPGQPVEAAPPSFAAVLRQFRAKRALFHCVAGASIAAFGSYSILTFAAPFFIRVYGATLSEAGLFLGLTSGVSAGIGIFLSGIVTDRLGSRDRRWAVWVPAIGLLLATPGYIMGFLAPTQALAMTILLVPPALQYLYMGPTFGLMHNMVTPRMRATATALLYLAVNLFGMGLGPTLTGFLSDRLAAAHFTGGDYAVQCAGGKATQAALDTLCRAASAEGVRWSLILATSAFLWAAIHYLIAARTLRADLGQTDPARQ
ncbi:MFS transporter [Sphingomonas naphthae]|uniref:MFS transporter n=1 Tax=Sphingomonas naphthae TaxID=1813468 RepID=A0ABY7TQ61_9SPHN|nr:MFS transporter [Sphingomonas naphthae]WCT75126.1 MFS transporter [Sphingomonas naphthae]